LTDTFVVRLKHWAVGNEQDHVDWAGMKMSEPVIWAACDNQSMEYSAVMQAVMCE